MKRVPKKITESSGVYLFKDKKNRVLYVGRAVNLKRRVEQYFVKNLDPRLAEMVSLAKEIEIHPTDTLLEAVILEANLIKKYWPKYNIREKDDKSFLYFVIPKSVKYPQPFIVRGRELNFNLSLRQPQTAYYFIFGPYQSISLLKAALKIIRRIIPYSDGNCVPQSGRPCFDYQIGLCPGVCLGQVSEKDYRKNIHNLILLLSGKKQRVLENLKKENPDKALSLQHIQDVSLLTNDELLADNPKLSAISRIEAYDVSHFGGKDTYGALVVFVEGQPDKSQYRLFKIKNAPPNNDLAALGEMLYRRFQHTEWQYPDLILIDGGTPQIKFCSKVLENIGVFVLLVGISKMKNDVLVFSSQATETDRKIIKNVKPILLKARDEAHRFGNQARKRAEKIKRGS